MYLRWWSIHTRIKENVIIKIIWEIFIIIIIILSRVLW
jgi:hypothetical protein